MLTKQDFEKMFGDVLDRFASNKFIGGPFESQGEGIIDSEGNPFYFDIGEVKSSAERFYYYINTLDKVNPNDRELFERFSEFAQSYKNLFNEVEEYYDNPENPNPIGEHRRFDIENHISKEGGFVAEFYYNADNPETLKQNVLPKFINEFCKATGLEVVQPKAKQKKQPEQAVVQETAAEECANFKKLATILDKAKTVKNSQEYKDLITMCKTLGDPEAVAKMGEKGRKEMLAATGKKITDYIYHKAKDGVKPNVFKKFAAVETLSKYLSTKLEPYKNEVINVCGSMDVEVSKLNLDFDKYRQSLPHSVKTGVDDRFFPYGSLDKLNQNNGVVQNNMKLATNLLRKVGYECAKFHLESGPIAGDLIAAGAKFTDPKFAEAELSGKNMDIEANKKNDGPQNVL